MGFRSFVRPSVRWLVVVRVGGVGRDGQVEGLARDAFVEGEHVLGRRLEVADGVGVGVGGGGWEDEHT